MIGTEQVAACGTLQPPFVAKVDLCRRWVTEVLEAVEAFDDVYDTNVSEVENRARDGFIPFTDGVLTGWPTPPCATLTAPARLPASSSPISTAPSRMPRRSGTSRTRSTRWRGFTPTTMPIS